MNTTATPLLLSALLTLTSPALAQDKEAAKEHFEKGVELFNNEDWVGALVEFKAAYEAAPHHAVRYNISACLYKLHRYSEAVAEMNAYLVEGGDEVPQDKREEVLGYLEEMSGLVGQLTVTSDVPGSVVLVNGEPVATLPLGEPLWLDVGEYKIVVKAPGHDPFITTLLLPGGAKKTIHAKFTEESEPTADLAETGTKTDSAGSEDGSGDGTGTTEGNQEVQEPGDAVAADGPPGGRLKLRPAGFWTVLSFTLISGGLATAAGSMALHWKLEYDRMDGDDEGWPSKKRDIEKQLIITNVLWGVTGALAVATLVVGLYTDFRKGKKDEEDSPEPGEVSLLVDPLGGGLALVGVF